jgi:hypothetical protein
MAGETDGITNGNKKKTGTTSEKMYDAKHNLAEAMKRAQCEWLSMCRERQQLSTMAECLHAGHRILYVCGNSSEYSHDDPVETFHWILGATGAALASAAQRE